MPTISDVRAQFPQYSDMSDSDLASALHQKFYADLPKEEFEKKIGLNSAPRATSNSISPDDFWPVRLAKGLLKSGISAATLPGDVYQGKVTPNDPEYYDRARELAAFATPASPGLAAGERAIPGVAKSFVPDKAAIPKIPTATELKEAAGAGYEKAGNMGVTLTADSIKNLGSDIQSGLEKDGVFAELAPKTFSILGKLREPPEGSVATLQNVDTVRKSLGHAAGDFTNKTEQLAAKRAVEQLDGFLKDIPPESVVAGPAAAAAKVLEAARANYGAAQRSNKITGELDPAFTGIQERAGLNAAVANSGQNVGNAVRQRVRDLLTRPKEARGYSPEELAQAEKVARGTVPANTSRFVGNLLGGGGGLGAMLTSGAGALAGTMTAGPFGAAGAALPVVGYASKQLSNALTGRQLNKLDEMIRMRSPLYQEQVANPNMLINSQPGNAAMMRALLGSQANQGGNLRFTSEGYPYYE